MSAEPLSSPALTPGKNPFLVALGERARALRSRRGMTRKAVAVAADVSERHLANLEYGEGNASILVLLQVAGALQCSLTELIGDVTTASPEWLLIRELLEQRDESALRKARIAIGEALGTGCNNPVANPRVALIGLRGAGKSTLGQMLADDLGFPFVELSREIKNLPAAVFLRFKRCTAWVLTAGTSDARWKKPSRSTRRRSSQHRAAWFPTPPPSTSC